MAELHEFTTLDGADDDFISVRTLRYSDRSTRHDYIHKVSRVFAAQLLGFSVFLLAIRWFEFTIHDYSNSWLLIFSLIINSIFSLVGLWKKRDSQVYSIAFTVLFTCIWAYLVNLAVFSFYSYSPANGCFIATGVFGAIAVFTMQTDHDIFSPVAAYFLVGSIFIISIAAHFIFSYQFIGEYLGALAIAFFIAAYIMVGIFRSTDYFTPSVKPTVSLAVTMGLVHPFIPYMAIDDFTFDYK
ncbi:hypothetical protein GGI03_003819 [Coemansia sp. RSA 2337]|nr:hypothetical protein LPJ71_002184 [Coemansia sp. S17]KAJ2051449.1 hypothetical protein H4S04_001977 [Coemansia sp. S16]KAJ2055730.1 hypothetical protein GGH13_007750 [Coemansia sp. S155-1]KAJ2116661.1 hypothetical protein IW146_001350 [Coemansia sp. RSA 922]KAJ2345786.1 hypothetical protein GGH92_003898 [Coemansia sp. RSA 2673]KAJ2463473.1 hypothetical protein GGI03_003819 [Coemansia sp. RSA 2337]